MALSVYGADGKTASAALSAAEAEIYRLDALLSISREGSDILRLNRSGEAGLSEETLALISRALELAEETGGAFDPTVLPLMEVWGFPSGNYRVPEKGELDELLSSVGWERVSLQGDTVALPAGGGMDLGGIAKGYAAECVLGIMEDSGAESALAVLGGNVGALGMKPDGSPWKVAVADPEDTGKRLALIELGTPGESWYAVTSGGYQRYFEENGRRYHHILDPETGAPAETDLTSVTVISRDGTLADALSTALFVMGREEAEDFWRSHRDEFEMVLWDGQTLYVTPGLTLNPERPCQEVAP